ncbi:hypothetical protein CYY_001141 [Polysphondylium violaceum]|uniref:Myb domain-containing protein n=1 Tax=Polysphondylium violaceum TaxID=133409 RepID=A0A8J4PYL2_9MYCE|nr:hypothetical protein CYY_001141 [Polysphondylium violaceum]
MKGDKTVSMDKDDDLNNNSSSSSNSSNSNVENKTETTPTPTLEDLPPTQPMGEDEEDEEEDLMINKKRNRESTITTDEEMSESSLQTSGKGKSKRRASSSNGGGTMTATTTTNSNNSNSNNSIQSEEDEIVSTRNNRRRARKKQPQLLSDEDDDDDDEVDDDTIDDVHGGGLGGEEDDDDETNEDTSAVDEEDGDEEDDDDTSSVLSKSSSRKGFNRRKQSAKKQQFGGSARPTRSNSASLDDFDEDMVDTNSARGKEDSDESYAESEDDDDDVDDESEEESDDEDGSSSKKRKSKLIKKKEVVKRSSPSTPISSTATASPPQSKTTSTTTTTTTTTTSTSTPNLSDTTIKESTTSPPKTPKKKSPPITSPVPEEPKPNTVLYHCDYCQKDISGVVRIRCSVCQDFDLCLECFSVGVEITPHKNDHDYHVIENMHFPMFTDSWGADEELLLLEAIELYGLGNWNDVSENVGTKSAPECKTHYFTYYLNTTTSPLPDTSNVLTSSENVQFKRAKPTTPPLTSDRINKDRNKSKIGGKSVNEEGPSGPVTDAVGFMKNRGHFEVEYDNDAEIVVKDLTFDAEDTLEDREIKLQVLESYSQRLDERIRRRNFIIDKGLLDYKKVERKRYKDDKEIVNSLKVFLQTIDKDEYETLLDGLITEKNLKNQIAQLQKYREAGIKSMTEGDIYEEEKRKRELERNTKKSKSDLSYLSSVSSIDKPTSTNPNHFKSPKQYTKEKEDTFLGYERKSMKLRKNAQLEMEGLPNSEVLSTKEKLLCTAIRILPQQYLVIKETLLAESLKTQGIIKQSVANKLIKLHQTKVIKLLEFFEQSGWLKRQD